MNHLLRWVEGRILSADDPAARFPDSPICPGRACYTTARIVRGRPLWPERHAQRLQRDALSLGIGDVPLDAVVRALCELGEASFGTDDGIVRIDANAASGQLRLTGVSRALGPEPDVWNAQLFDTPHPGPMPWGGAKASGTQLAASADRTLREAPVDELLLADRDGFLVEGARSNLLTVDASGELAAVPLTRGAVAGLALALLRERVPDIAEREVHTGELFRLRELIAVNAVRGAHALVRVDGRAIGDGRPNRWARRLATALEN